MAPLGIRKMSLERDPFMNTLVFECKTEAVAKSLLTRTQSAAVPCVRDAPNSVQITSAFADDTFVRVCMYGPENEAYWQAFELAEKSNHTIALLGCIRSGAEVSQDYFDILTCPQFGAGELRYEEAEHAVMESFMDVPMLRGFSTEELQRIIHMCHLEDSVEPEVAVAKLFIRDMKLHGQFPDGYYETYSREMKKIQNMSTGKPGDRLLQRAMVYILMLEDSRPKSVSEKISDGLQRMFIY